MLHIHLRGLRKPEGNQISYDALSFALSCKLIRELQNGFLDIDRSTDAVEVKNTQKIKMIKEETLKLLDQVSQPIDGVIYPDGTPVSILSVSLKESQRFDGNENWGEKEALVSLKRSLFGLNFNTDREGNIRMLTEKDLGKKVMEHVWKYEIDREDKLQLLYIAIKSPDCKIWNEISDYRDRIIISRTLGESGQLPEKFQDMIMASGEKNLFDIIGLRCETVRDIKEPRGLSQKYPL